MVMQVHCGHRLLGQYRLCKAKQRSLRILDQPEPRTRRSWGRQYRGVFYSWDFASLWIHYQVDNLLSFLCRGRWSTDILHERSRINADVGGRTQMASLVCSTIVLLVTFFLLPSLYYLPKCVLASV
jgi:hypothetical protein